MQTFDTRLNVVTDNADSLLAALGRLIAPLLAPLGNGDWRVATALLSGFTAKEAVVSTLGVLLGVGTAELPTALHTMFSPLNAAAFLAFTLLYTPCVAAIATIKNELGSGLKTVGVVIMQCAIAWVAGTLIYQIGSLLL